MALKPLLQAWEDQNSACNEERTDGYMSSDKTIHQGISSIKSASMAPANSWKSVASSMANLSCHPVHSASPHSKSHATSTSSSGISPCTEGLTSRRLPLPCRLLKETCYMRAQSCNRRSRGHLLSSRTSPGLLRTSSLRSSRCFSTSLKSSKPRQNAQHEQQTTQNLMSPESGERLR